MTILSRIWAAHDLLKDQCSIVPCRTTLNDRSTNIFRVKCYLDFFHSYTPAITKAAELHCWFCGSAWTVCTWYSAFHFWLVKPIQEGETQVILIFSFCWKYFPSVWASYHTIVLDHVLECPINFAVSWLLQVFFVSKDKELYGRVIVGKAHTQFSDILTVQVFKGVAGSP